MLRAAAPPEALRRKTAALLILLGMVAALGLSALPRADASGHPTLRLLRTSASVTLENYGSGIDPDLGVYFAAVGGDFAVKARHPEWGQPVQAAQIDAQGRELRTVPAALVDGTGGWRDFHTISFLDQRGREVASQSVTYCPNGMDRQRVSDIGPRESRYPMAACSTHFPFRRGSVWGIDAGWAFNAHSWSWSDEGEPAFDLPAGTYTARLRISAAWADFLAIPAREREVSVKVTVVAYEWPEEPELRAAGGDDGHERHADADHAEERAREARAIYTAAERDHATHQRRQASLHVTRPTGQADQQAWSRDEATAQAAANVTTTTTPPAGTLPDLAALPAWAMHTDHVGGRDMLNFAATPWNAGPGSFIVEGFRQPRKAVMDAYQYFVDTQGQVVGRAPIGTMEFHAGGGHDHWHFLQFAAFDLLTLDARTTVRSGKQGFCIAPTDAVDLTLPGAAFDPGELGFSACGGPNALWVREVLAPGWGDTYMNVHGQAFDITSVRNGRYLVQVRVDPQRVIHQTTRENDAAVREVILGGTKGQRTVEVLPWNGIDG